MRPVIVSDLRSVAVCLPRSWKNRVTWRLKARSSALARLPRRRSRRVLAPPADL